MTKFPKFLIIVIMGAVAFSCNSPASNDSDSQAAKDSTSSQVTPVAVKKSAPEYKATKFVDDFISTNSAAIKQSAALKDQYEASCTRQILPLIDKNGLYDDLPFTLTATTTNDGVAYGNFIYEDDRHFIKVTCTLKEKQVAGLKENDKYLIKFKTVKFGDAVSFEGATGKIELPDVDANLISFTAYQK